jgi:hypothetical protein
MLRQQPLHHQIIHGIFHIKLRMNEQRLPDACRQVLYVLLAGGEGRDSEGLDDLKVLRWWTARCAFGKVKGQSVLHFP